MSATRPACEFSIGMIARAARPSLTASSASSNAKHGSGRLSGANSVAARCELQPGAPWSAIARAGSAAARADHRSDQIQRGLGETVHRGRGA